ncbi:hypothetical protein B0T25DRAFT_556493 [Lasiosphaeria hispida]|uniref:Peptidase S1 domain-containing protein n=1 Tax=Lasiosphaeria hispida TaxID=260671 RepID=A0AAJ0H9H5_9PEZI|nr:hypothetical protein B0T25DRAFT_556493 [Lasiosphaeria hispida]
MVCPFHVVLEEGLAPPSDAGTFLIVTVHPCSLSVEAAEEVVYQLYQVLLRFGLNSMGIEICESAVTYFGSDFQLPGVGCSFAQAYGQPMLGTSIGPAGDSGQTGSLGFYLKVEYQGNTDVLAITCHHVIAPGKEAPVRPQDPPLTIESPGQVDHNAWTAGLAQAVKNSAAIDDFFAGMQSTTAGPSQVDHNAGTAGLSDELRLQTAHTFSRDIGLVHISSGMSDIIHDCRLDWALVELRASQFADGLERLSNKPPAHLLEYLFAHRYNPHEAAARNIVFKVGRTTGPTMGIASGCRAVVQVFQSKTVRSIEHVITSCSSAQCFARPGDSGAPVYGACGDGQFMVWGGLEQREREPAAVALDLVVFATPIQTILHHVEAKLSQAIGHTNFKVTLA